ncbi:hypothetical protein QBC42DRAFT_251128 [Cladorrhinum samala]|uniref:Ecp2 effector protein-like domain-containing protein n=1 Tax=Cladorrhinum samala TaxID=585594 RepID=A0AAV9HRD2_9PEZI|nr:hypothetical protein QBC42DRAFT_251128 [Cladorrhinum samala]
MVALALGSRAFSIFSASNAEKSHGPPSEPWSHNMTAWQDADAHAPLHVSAIDWLGPRCEPSYDITDETSLASPLIADCETMRDHVDPRSAGAVINQRTIATWGTCAFGTEIDDDDADPKARVIMERVDVIDAINGLLAKPRGDRVRMGGKGWMKYQDLRYDLWWSVKWGVYHTK